MSKSRQLSDEAVQDVTARIHHHRQAAEIVEASLGVVLEYLLAERPASHAQSDYDIYDAVRASAMNLQKCAEALIVKLANEQDDPGKTLCAEWQRLRDEISDLETRSDAASVPLIRQHAIEARKLAASTLSAVGTSRPKELAKRARAVATDLHGLTAEYELLRAQRLLTATTEGLLIPINILEGAPLDRASLRPSNVPDVVRESIRLHTASAQRRGIEFKDQFNCATAYVALSSDELLRALGNLFSNAIKYMGTLGPHSDYDFTWITVTTSATRSTVSVAVESWGAPFTPDELLSGSIFEWGKRGHFSWKVAGAEGSGIGLHDTKTIVNRIGGSVIIDSVGIDRFAQFENRVTTVTMHLPRLDD
jgi:signal transduction histidine kinase